MNISMESEFGDQEVGGSKEACGLSHLMDFARVPDRNGEKCVKVELSSPGPATPMQAAPLPQQKPRESNKSSTIMSTTKVTHAFQPVKTICESQLALRSLKPLSAATQDAVQSQKENALLLAPSNQCTLRGSQTLQKTATPLAAVHHGVGHPSLNRALATLGTPTRSLLQDEVQLHLPSKTTQDETSLSSSAVMELASSDRSITSMGRPTSNLKAESFRYSMDAGLSLGSNALQISGSKEKPAGDLSRVWETGTGSVGQNRFSYVPNTPNEGTVVLQLSQGGALNAQGETFEMDRDRDWKGKHLQGSFGFHRDGKPQDWKVVGNVEHYLSQVQEHNTSLCVEHNANPATNSTNDRSKKRVKREIVDPRVTFNQSREQMWEMDDDQDSRRSGMYENNHKDLGSSFFRNDPTYLLPLSSREKVLDKVFPKVLDVPSAEPKTMVVKKTPKRVHNSDPNSFFHMSELLMLEDSVKSPRSISPHLMFTPSNKPGMNGAMLASDLANSMSQQRVRKSENLGCARETALDYSHGIQDGSSVQQSQLESRLDTVSACSLMSTSQHALSVGEPSLPLTLNFSSKPHRPVVPVSKTSTASTEEDWGKSLALCGPGAESPSEVECSVVEPQPMNYQDRFVQLQVFLKKCDEDDQSYLLQALRSLSAAARSSHAVGLEQRAMWLSMEEGKEMARLKSLNVMGQRTNIKGQSEAGCTPQGPHVPAFITAADYPQQQSLANMRSPQMQMQMQMSGSMPSSAYTEACYSA